MVKWFSKPTQDRDAPAILAQARQTCHHAMAHLDESHKILPPALPNRYGVGIVSDFMTKREDKIRTIRSSCLQSAHLARFEIVG